MNKINEVKVSGFVFLVFGMFQIFMSHSSLVIDKIGALIMMTIGLIFSYLGFQLLGEDKKTHKRNLIILMVLTSIVTILAFLQKITDGTGSFLMPLFLFGFAYSGFKNIEK